MTTYGSTSLSGNTTILLTLFYFLDLIAERLRREDLWQHEPEWQHYYGLNGTPDLLNVTVNFLQERLAKVI